MGRRLGLAFRLAGLWALLAVVAAAGGCARKIGDPCTLNIECSPAGDRVCDPSQPDGYCTQEDCLAGTCPENEAICVRFLALTSLPCYDDSGNLQCERGDLCVEGFCAPMRSERRACMRICTDNHDCRDGYQCSSGGVGGSQIVDVGIPDARYCAPSTQTPVVVPVPPM